MTRPATPLSACRDGIARVRAAPALLAGVYAVLLLITAPGAWLVHGAMADHLGASTHGGGGRPRRPARMAPGVRGAGYRTRLRRQHLDRRWRRRAPQLQRRRRARRACAGHTRVESVGAARDRLVAGRHVPLGRDHRSLCPDAAASCAGILRRLRRFVLPAAAAERGRGRALRVGGRHVRAGSRAWFSSRSRATSRPSGRRLPGPWA